MRTHSGLAVRAIGEAERFHSKLVARTPGRRRPAEEEQFVIGDVVYASSPAAGRWVKLPMRPSDRASLSSSVAAFEIDNIAAAVPEPETYAMLALGLGVVGWASRRRQSV